MNSYPMYFKLKILEEEKNHIKCIKSEFIVCMIHKLRTNYIITL